MKINFRNLRMIHLYLGCIFAPLLVFFVVSGCLQTFDLHESRKDGYHAPAVFRSMASVHQYQSWPDPNQKSPSSEGFRIFVLLMSTGFLITTVLGVMMALQSSRPIIVWGCLLAGTVIPILLLRFFLGAH